MKDTLLRWLLPVLLLFVAAGSMANVPVQEYDSVRRSVSQCREDSGKVAILLKMFRQYKDVDYARASFYSRWMYDAFKDVPQIKLRRIVHFSRGEALLNEEKYDSAIVYYSKAMAFSDELGKAQCYYRMGKANDRLGKQELALNQLQTANTYFREVKSYKNIHGTYDLMIAIHARKGEYDAAIRLVKKKLDLDRTRNSAIKEMEDHVSMASLYGQQNKFDFAFEHLSQALDIAEETKSGFAEIYLSIGKLFLQKKNRTIARMYFNKSLEQFTTREPDDVLAETYNNLGKIHLEEGHLVEALQEINRALMLAKKNGYRHHLADAYHLMGQCEEKAGHRELALNNLLLCVETGCNVCSRLAFFDVMVEIADLYKLQGNRSQSEHWYATSLLLAENFNAKREISVATQRLGSWYVSQGNFSMAERYFQQSVVAARASKQPATMKEIADVLSVFYAAQGDFKQAYRFEKWSNELGNRISELDGKANMAALEMNFEFEHLRKANEARQLRSREEIRQQKQYRNFLLIILVLLAALAAVMYSSYRKKKRDNRLLLEQKQQIEEKNRAILNQMAEINEQKDEIERISNKLHEADVMKLRFFSNISHEIRTPLTLILHPLKQLLQSFSGDEKQKHQLKLVYENTVRLQELTNQILELQKLDSGKLELNLVREEVVEHLRGVVALFEGLGNDRRCRMLFRAQHTAVSCAFDRDKLTKMLSNLLSNAFKYNKVGGDVSIFLTFGENDMTVVVEDQGIGIPEEMMRVVFDRYVQVDGTNPTYEGTGIGLAYVKELTDLMKGKIELSSEVGVGTRIAVCIPVGPVQVLKEEALQLEIKPNAMTKLRDLPSAEREDEFVQTILIVEDNADLCAMIAGIFDDTCQVVYALNGKEGLDKAIQFIPDVIVSDVMMPLMDGLELCAALKKHELTCHIPVLLLTAKDSHEHHLLGYQSGADDYMVKPFDSDILKLKIQNMLETREAMKRQFSLDNQSEKLLSPYNQLDRDFLNKCLSLVQEHLDDPDFSVDVLSEKTALGKRSLFRKMKALTNLSPYEFITTYRLKQAASLLKSGQRVTEVAYAVGFANAQSFSIAFKKQFGQSPTEFKG